MTDYTIASSVNIEKGKQNEEYCVEQVISFQQQTNMEKVSHGQKYTKKIEKVCGQTSFISDMKLYTISLQNPNSTRPCPSDALLYL
jgi:hypothetical protein